MGRKKRYITASEIGQFHFCPVSWYLQKKGFQPASMLLNKGVKTHQRVGSMLKKTTRNQRKMMLLRFLGMVLIIVAGILMLLEVI